MNLTHKQIGIIQLMKEGWEMAYDNFMTKRKCWVQKNGVGKGGESIRVEASTFKALKEKGLIKEEYNYPTSTYRLTESGLAVKTSTHHTEFWKGFDYACSMLDEMYAKSHPHKFNIADCLKAKVNRLDKNKLRKNPE